MDDGMVLVVEDDAAIRGLMREILRMGGYDVVECADGPGAVPLAREHLPDAILLDIGLPGMNGLQVLEELKAEPLTAAIPVIMVTAWSEPEYVERAQHAGAHDYVRKPFDTTELIARVAAAVRIKARHDAARAPVRSEAAIDTLTGLPNRRGLDATLAAAAAGGSAGVLLIDLDGFRSANDALGRPAGDAILCDVAARLRVACGEGETPGRWGGDEFMVVVPGATEAAMVSLAERVRSVIAATPMSIPGGSVPVTACVGHASGTGDVVARAEAALREQKSHAGVK